MQAFFVGFNHDCTERASERVPIVCYREMRPRFYCILKKFMCYDCFNLRNRYQGFLKENKNSVSHKSLRFSATALFDDSP